MPIPVSANSATTRPAPAGPPPPASPGAAAFDVRIVSRPPLGVNLAALRTRFQAICISRAWSARTCEARASSSSTTSSPAIIASSRQISTARRSARCRSTTSRSSRSRPRAIRERSSRSSISRDSSSMFRRIISSAGSDAGSGPASISAATPIRAGVSGVRSSWLSTARNRSLAREAASACSLATRTSASVCFRSVTSSMKNEQSPPPSPESGPVASIAANVPAIQPGARGQLPGSSNRTGRPVSRHRRNRSSQADTRSGGSPSSPTVCPSTPPGVPPNSRSVGALAETIRTSSSTSSTTPIAIADDS